MQPTVVENESELRVICERLRAAGVFAFDTEFVGEEHYQPQVCLIQVADFDHCWLIDPLAGIDSTPVWELVADPHVRVVVHAGWEDLSLCRQTLGRPAANVLDLQIVAGLVGLGYPISLARLVQAVLRRHLHKGHTLTDWRKRPLTASQIRYASEDVIHLPQAAEAMQRELETRGRLDWALEECEALCRRSEVQAVQPPEKKRLRGMSGLSPRARVIAEALMAERDLLAREYDRPARGVIRDHLLVELARQAWTDPTDIATLRGMNLSRAGLQRLGRAVERAKNTKIESETAAPSIDTDAPRADEEAAEALIMAVLKDLCRREDLAYSLVADRQSIRDLVRSLSRGTEETPQGELLRGWRGEAVGGPLNAVLAGRAAIRMTRRGRVMELETGPAAD